MAGTPRTRKTAAPTVTEADPGAAPEETTELETAAADTVEESATAADTTPAAPDAAPLEPPAVQEPPAAPAAAPYATPTEVIPDDENLADVIVDDATQEPPVDVDAVFAPLTEYGSVLVCTVRLVERTFLGPHLNPVHRLLQPQGAHVSEGVAKRILERLQAQAARQAAADTTDEQ
ncbi:hypothetical protein ABTY59_31710 [Streptomyces sp. NPDC096079]|uniref:hypothetical protein n=1 Tax=Streptomyces sp. NPDC096079 TaxID=3155820 RepID=UPI003319E741